MGSLAGIAGANIRRARRARKLSLEALGAASGVDVKYLGRIERGEANCTLAVLERIARALDLEGADLLRAPLAAAPRPLDVGALLARIDESVTSVREAIATYAAAPKARKRLPRKRAR
jgi:transcriptional regulator with XRE-family HTH domain